MARGTQRAFLTSLELTQTQQAEKVDWDKLQNELNDPDFVPEYYPPAPCVTDLLDEHFDEVTARANLIQALQEAQQVGFDPDNTKELATRLNAVRCADMPSMEAFCAFPCNATSVSLEALRDSVKETFKAILRALARFWAALMDQVQSWLELSKLVRTRIAVARGKLREVAGKRVVQETVSGSVVPYLSTDKVSAKEARGLIDNLNVLGRQLTLLRQNYLPMVVEITQVFMKEFERWGVGANWNATDDAREWLEALNYAAYEYRPAQALKATHPYADKQSPHWRSDATMTDCLPGFRWLVVIPAEPVDSSAVTLRKAYALQTARVVVEDVYSRNHTGPESIDTFSQNEIEKILDTTEQIVKEIEVLTHSDARRSLREMTLRLDAFAKANLEVPDGSVALFQAGVAYARTISRWAKDPYQGVVLHALNVCNNSVRMCGLHTRAYKEAPKTKETTP